MRDRTQFSFELDPELLERLKIVALRKRKSVSKILRDFVQWYVDQEEKQ